MLKCGAILLAAGIVKEVMIILVALLLLGCLIWFLADLDLLD
jgi:hypothetical protein